MKTRPVAFTRSRIASLRRRSSASSSTPGGRWRKQTVENGTGASSSQPGSARIARLEPAGELDVARADPAARPSAP